MMKNIDQIRPSRFSMNRLFMKSMDKIKSQLKRCRVLKLYEQGREHVQVADHDSRTCGGVVFMGKDTCSSKATAIAMGRIAG